MNFLYSTISSDEVIGKSSIWLKLYPVKLLNISKKVSKRVLQNMNSEKKTFVVNVGNLTTKSQVLSLLHSTSRFNCKYFLLGYRVGWAKSPRILPPSPPRFLRFFGDFPPKNPQRLSLPRPQSIPKPFRGSIPVPIPVFGGFLGIEPQKNSKSNPSPSPKNPQNRSKGLPHPRPVPKIRGGDGENRGLGPRFTTLIVAHNFQYFSCFDF